MKKETEELLHSLLHRTRFDPAPSWRRIPFSEIHHTIYHVYNEENGKLKWNKKDPVPVEYCHGERFE